MSSKKIESLNLDALQSGASQATQKKEQLARRAAKLGKQIRAALVHPAMPPDSDDEDDSAQDHDHIGTKNSSSQLEESSDVTQELTVTVSVPENNSDSNNADAEQVGETVAPCSLNCDSLQRRNRKMTKNMCVDQTSSTELLQNGLTLEKFKDKLLKRVN